MVGEAGALILLAGIILAQLLLSRSGYLFGRIFWFDEQVTLRLVCDPSLRNSLRAIVAGLDTNPPGYHLLLRLVYQCVGGFGPVGVRCLSLATLLAGMVGLYLSLREVSSPLVAVAATVAVWSHPLTLRLAFEARMYGAWLAALPWFAFFLVHAWTSPFSPGLLVGVAVCSLLVCALHTLGCLSLLLLVGGFLLAHLADPWPWTVAAAASLGPVAFCAWLPILRGQNEAYPLIWLKETDLTAALSFLPRVLLPGPVRASSLVLGALTAVVLVGVWGGSARPPQANGDPGVLVGLAALALQPVVLAILSLTVQPLVEVRYASPTVLAIAPVVAWIGSLLPDSLVLALCAVVFAAGTVVLHILRSKYVARDHRTAELVQSIREHAADQPILIEENDDFAGLRLAAPDLADRCTGMDLEPDDMDQMDEYRICNRDQLRYLTRFYPEFQLMTWDRIQQLPELFLVPTTRRAPPKPLDDPSRYHGYTVVPVAAGLCRLLPTEERGPALVTSQPTEPLAASTNLCEPA
jgi:hypothetical protein